MNLFSSRIFKIIILLVFIALLLGVGYVAYTRLEKKEVDAPSSPPPPPPNGKVEVEGTVLCLPHRDMNAPHTLECAFGVRDTQGRYYALRDTSPDYENISSVPMNVRVKVRGIFVASENSIYPTIGTITIEGISVVDTLPLEKSGIKGNVTLGPTCPVMKNPPDPKCADKPYKANFVIGTPDGARIIKTFSSDDAGVFKVNIEPGTYSVRPAAIADILPRCGGMENVVVRPSSYTNITITCDTGIR